MYAECRVFWIFFLWLNVLEFLLKLLTKQRIKTEMPRERNNSQKVRQRQNVRSNLSWQVQPAKTEWKCGNVLREIFRTLLSTQRTGYTLCSSKHSPLRYCCSQMPMRGSNSLASCHLYFYPNSSQPSLYTLNLLEGEDCAFKHSCFSCLQYLPHSK